MEDSRFSVDWASNSDCLARVVGHLNVYLQPRTARLMRATPEQTELAREVLEMIGEVRTYVGLLAREQLADADRARRPTSANGGLIYVPDGFGDVEAISIKEYEERFL